MHSITILIAMVALVSAGTIANQQGTQPTVRATFRAITSTRLNVQQNTIKAVDNQFNKERPVIHLGIISTHFNELKPTLFIQRLIPFLYDYRLNYNVGRNHRARAPTKIYSTL